MTKYSFQMTNPTVKWKIEGIIEELNFLEVDGETMQYILREVGLDNQMLRQLIMSMPLEAESIFEEKQQLEEFNKK
jgi:hypothetical protein